MRRLIVLLTIGAALSAAPALAASTRAITCGYVHASVPYTAHGHGRLWRVYVTGHTSCATATKVLNAIMHLQGTEHANQTEAGSYITYSGWLCPFGQMGEQTCDLPTRLPAHRPILANALALTCTGGPGERCPSEVPASRV